MNMQEVEWLPCSCRHCKIEEGLVLLSSRTTVLLLQVAERFAFVSASYIDMYMAQW